MPNEQLKPATLVERFRLQRPRDWFAYREWSTGGVVVRLSVRTYRGQDARVLIAIEFARLAGSFLLPGPLDHVVQLYCAGLPVYPPSTEDERTTISHLAAALPD